LIAIQPDILNLHHYSISNNYHAFFFSEPKNVVSVVIALLT